MQISLRETIKEIVRSHLAQGYLAMGQCLSAVGWVGGTLPELYENDGMVDLSMADVAGGGFAVGAALVSKRPIYIIRYQGFNWFNAPIIINYACKSKELWDRPCPMFIRSIAMEGNIGPVAGSSHTSLYYRMPGVVIASPMTSKEYTEVYSSFMNSDDVYYVSEHRAAFSNESELPDYLPDEVDFTLVAINVTRFAAHEAVAILENQGINVAVVNINWIKPLKISSDALSTIKKSNHGFMVLDNDYVDGIAKPIAFDLSAATGKKGYVLGLKNRTAGFSAVHDNLPPTSAEIVMEVLGILK
jgi:pyruvate/2-oxoglutarate/acetoin dehydrogenase E1 component